MSTLLPNPCCLALEAVVPSTEAITFVVTTRQTTAPCPLCGQTATRVHSRYRRTLADLPLCGIAVRLRLKTRKFFCDNPHCSRRIFTQRLPEVVQSYARKTNRLQEILHLIGLALGGAAGARLTVELGMGTSPDTLLRRVLGKASPHEVAPRVLGVDDFALRRGYT